VAATDVSASELSLRRDPVALTPPADPAQPQHAFTVDVEDWYQSCLDYDAPITERVVRNLERTLAVLDEAQVKGSFFVQGRVAETFPSAVSALVAAGHEVQSHGYSHRPLFAMNQHELREELTRAKETVEDAAGTPVTAFRAQDFSVVASNLWALETLADVGFEIDSSVFPMRSRHYGVPAGTWAHITSRSGTAGASSRCRWRSGRSAASASRSPAAATSVCCRPPCSAEVCTRLQRVGGPPSSIAIHTSSTIVSSMSTRHSAGAAPVTGNGPRALHRTSSDATAEIPVRTADRRSRRLGSRVKIAFLTTDDPIYLPSFFDRVLSIRADEGAVFVVPPLYKNQTSLSAAQRYLRTFGLRAAVGLTARIVRAKLRRQSIERVCERHGVSCEARRMSTRRNSWSNCARSGPS
jgi:hypothetical protein